MVIDIAKRRPVLFTGIGGLSGPAIRPVAVRMVFQAARAVKLPIVGIGGIMTASDALQFIMAGASAIQVGTASFVDPDAAVKIIKGIEAFMSENGLKDISELVGAAL